MKESELVTLQELQYAIKNVGSFDLGDFSFDTIQHILNMYSQLEKENAELERMLRHRIKYSQELEQDLFEGCSNYVIPKSVIREKIEQFKRLSAEIQGYDYECIPKDLKRNDYAVKMLEELLGE